MNTPNWLADLSVGTIQDIRRMIGEERQKAGVERSYNLGLGLVNYDLQRPAKQTEVFYFPFLAMMPHVQGDGGTSTHWKVIDAINTGLIEGWVGEGARQQRIGTHLTDALASYATFGLEDSLTFEAKGAANGLEDAMARLQGNLLLETQRRLEYAVIGANAGLALGTPTAPTIADLATGGTVHASTAVYCAVVALTPYGAQASSVAGGVVQPTTATAPDGKTVTNGYGASNVSAPSNLTTAADGNNTHRVSATVPPVAGAVAYAWMFGTSSTTMRITAITSLNSVVLTAPVPTTGQLSTAITVDNSEAPGWDGFISLAFQNGTVITQATGTAGTGTGLTADGAGGIKEIEDLFQGIFDATRVSPKWIAVSSQEARNIRTKTIAGGSAPLFRFQMDAGTANPITGARVVGSYMNMFTVDGGQLVKIILHPYIPKGTIFVGTDTVPGEIIPSNNLGQLFEFHVPSPEDEMHATQWPVTTREYQTGVYTRGVMAHYFPKTLGVITNIANS